MKQKTGFNSYILRGQQAGGTYFISCIYPLELRESDYIEVSALVEKLKDVTEKLKDPNVSDEQAKVNKELLRIMANEHDKTNKENLRRMTKNQETNLLVMLFRPVSVMEHLYH